MNKSQAAQNYNANRIGNALSLFHLKNLAKISGVNKLSSNKYFIDLIKYQIEKKVKKFFDPITEENKGGEKKLGSSVLQVDVDKQIRNISSLLPFGDLRRYSKISDLIGMNDYQKNNYNNSENRNLTGADKMVRVVVNNQPLEYLSKLPRKVKRLIKKRAKVNIQKNKKRAVSSKSNRNTSVSSKPPAALSESALAQSLVLPSGEKKKIFTVLKK
jgi:hypothetical protein